MILFLIFIIAVGLFILHYTSLLSTQKHSYMHGETKREYLVHLPPSYNASKNLPMIMVLHAYGDNPKLIEIYSGWSRKADKEGFIAVYPYGTSDQSNNKLSWNGGSCCGAPLMKDTDDVGFVNGLAYDMIQRYKVDSSKVFLTGFSNGGLLTHRIAAEDPNNFAGFAVVAGSIEGQVKDGKPYYKTPKPSKPVSILMMHGEKDTSIPYEGGENKAQNGSFSSFDESVKFWVENNKSSEITTAEDSLIIQDSYKNEISDIKVEAYTIKNGSHIWFGGLMEIRKNIMRQSISATDTIWSFFQSLK